MIFLALPHTHNQGIINIHDKRFYNYFYGNIGNALSITAINNSSSHRLPREYDLSLPLDFDPTRIIKHIQSSSTTGRCVTHLHLKFTKIINATSEASTTTGFRTTITGTAQGQTQITLNIVMQIRIRPVIAFQPYFAENELRNLIKDEVFFNNTQTLINYAQITNKALYLTSLLGVMIQSTHRTEVHNTQLRIYNPNSTGILFTRNLTFDQNLQPIKMIE